jgi:hypothetical protein
LRLWRTLAVELPQFGLAANSSVFHLIEFCSWCGARLPPSLRDQYFNRLEALGLEPESAELPLDMRSDAWWRMERLA